MGPPPTPIDPTLESYGAAPTPSLGLDQLFLTSPGAQHRSYSYPKDLSLFLQDSQGSSMRPTQVELNPSLNAQPDPWDSQRINGGATQPQLMNHGHTGARERVHQSGPLTRWETRTHSSGIDSSTGRHIQDSGYYTQTHGTATIFSGDVGSTHDCQSLAGGTTEMDLRREELQPFSSIYPEPPPDYSIGFAGQQRGYPPNLICEVCQKKSNNRSDFKYVILELNTKSSLP
jgi:hypothetical protein